MQENGCIVKPTEQIIDLDDGKMLRILEKPFLNGFETMWIK